MVLNRSVAVWIAVSLMTLAVGCQKTPPNLTANHNDRSAQTPRGPSGPAGFPPAVRDKPYPATGVVTLINKKEGWIEINHDEIKDLMPAMQMEFWVKDQKLLDKVSVGDRVDFTIVETQKGEYLTEISRRAGAIPSR